MISTLAIGAVPITFISNFGDFRADRKSTRLNSSHSQISYAVFCLKKKKSPYTDRFQPPFAAVLASRTCGQPRIASSQSVWLPSRDRDAHRRRPPLPHPQADQ